MYADYDFYKTEYSGELGEAEYSRFSKLATAHIDRLTNNRAKTATGADLEAVKRAECGIVDELDLLDKGGFVSAESNDGISRTYAVAVRTPERRIYDVARVYLHNTNLMFAGV